MQLLPDEYLLTVKLESQGQKVVSKITQLEIIGITSDAVLQDTQYGIVIAITCILSYEQLQSYKIVSLFQTTSAPQFKHQCNEVFMGNFLSQLSDKKFKAAQVPHHKECQISPTPENINKLLGLIGR